MITFASTSVVVLAAGLSRRYGASNKLLADCQGKPLALHIAETLAPLPFHQRIAVCPDEQGPLASLFIKCGFTIAVNPDPGRGQASSLAIGVAEAAKAGPDAIMICLADMPGVSAALIGDLIGFLKSDEIGIVASAGFREGTPSPPAIFVRRHFETLLALEGDRGAGSLLRGAPTVLVPDDQLVDLDRRPDFKVSD